MMIVYRVEKHCREWMNQAVNQNMPDLDNVEKWLTNKGSILQISENAIAKSPNMDDTQLKRFVYDELMSVYQQLGCTSQYRPKHSKKVEKPLMDKQQMTNDTYPNYQQPFAPYQYPQMQMCQQPQMYHGSQHPQQSLQEQWKSAITLFLKASSKFMSKSDADILETKLLEFSARVILNLNIEINKTLGMWIDKKLVHFKSIMECEKEKGNICLTSDYTSDKLADAILIELGKTVVGDLTNMFNREKNVSPDTEKE